MLMCKVKIEIQIKVMLLSVFYRRSLLHTFLFNGIPRYYFHFISFGILPLPEPKKSGRPDP